MPAGTVMLTSRATIGEVAINTVPMATNQGFINVVCNESVAHNEFLAYWMQHNRKIFQERAHGVTFKEITKSNFKTIPITLPPLAEQRAIAEALRATQEAQHVRQNELALECERKAALMQHLFTYGTRGEAHKKTEIGEMPKGWQVKNLGSVASVVSGGTPERSKPEFWGGSIPWVKTGEINYNIITDAKERITELGLNNSSARVVPEGTLLMAMYGQGVTRGRVAILGIPAAINQACAAIQPSPEVSVVYLFHYLTYKYDNIRRLGHGANQQNLNALLIKSFPIATPTKEEQEEIAEVLDAVAAKIKALEGEAQLLDELFAAMLERLMSGQLSALPLIEAEAAA